MYLKKKISNLFFYFLILSFGYYFTLLKGYGSDGDTIGLINTFVNFIENDNYSPSRGYGHPIAELIIGLLSYNFGATVSTFLSFIVFFLSLILFYFSFDEFFLEDKLKVFIILCLSNSLLLFDNINSSDFPWSLFFFSLGFFLMRKEQYFFCCMFFALSVGCRYNFIIFVYAAIFSHWVINFGHLNFQKFGIISLGTFFGILIIFLPLYFFYSEGISFSFQDRVAVPGQGYNIESLFPRFIYKNFKLFGVYTSFAILFFIIKEFFYNKKKFLNSIIFKYSILIILTNLIIFFIFPAKISYLHSGIILIYLILVFILKKKYLYLLIVLNFLQWFVSYDLIKITYKHQDICKPIHAISAKIDPHYKLGEYFSMLEKTSIKDCFSESFSKGLPIKLDY